MPQALRPVLLACALLLISPTLAAAAVMRPFLASCQPLIAFYS